ncbi:hypothetical protein EV421DRAFT_2038299 [Armillaria borealis]|uniref:F-box domain-containing protein n=1 Tax=Armillaria borealis TaxID=47425 RepID=A0AA39J8W0_9AGAR|nr:hypothetical protein EV421DRAFT_2038299 [Armillaria borealis]
MALWNYHASRRATSLADLPNELLIMIFHQISTDDMVAVACICRRLNEVMFSYHFHTSKKLLGDYVQFGNIGRPFSSLRHLRLCFVNKPHITSMTFRFSASFEKEMKEVDRYLASISHVPALHIDFRSLSFVPLPGVKQCQSTILLSFKDFCETLSKLKCRTLTTSAYASSLKLLEDPIFKPPPLTTLRTVTLYAQPKHFMDWLIGSMNHSNVRSLTVMFNGADILPRLTLPRLTNLLCRGPDTSLVAVSAFLSRHPTLQSLHLLGGTSPTNKSLLQDGIGLFPCMTSINASADTLATLLEFPRAFPILQDVCMQGPVTANDTNIRLVQEIFILISRIPTITTIKFPLTNLASKGWDSFDYRAGNATR